jgi:tetratricopeptide (TPR) repeat protein
VIWRSLILVLMLFASSQAGINEDFQNGVKLYDQGDFQSSARQFQSIIDKGYSSAGLYYNAGCAYFKAGKLGQAIANFRRAQRLAPDDEDIQANLKFAQLFAVDKVDQTHSLLKDRITDYLGIISPNNYFLITFIAIVLLFGYLALRRIGYLRAGNIPVVILALVVVVSVSSMIWVLDENYLVKEGVIVANQTDVLSGPGQDFELQFEGHEGLRFEILDERSNYYLGLFANKLKGWVNKSDVVQI